MQQFFDNIAGAIRVSDPSITAGLSPTLPAMIAAMRAANDFDPTPTSIRAGAMPTNPYLRPSVDGAGRLTLEQADGAIRGQWKLSIYGHARKAPGTGDFIADGEAFPSATYVVKDVRGVLYATDSRLIYYFPYGSNGFMFGLPHADGRVRAGHIRYEWVRELSYQDGGNNFSIVNMFSRPGRLTVEYVEPDGTGHRLACLFDLNPPVVGPIAESLRQLIVRDRFAKGVTYPQLQQPFHLVTNSNDLLAWDAPGFLNTNGQPAA